MPLGLVPFIAGSCPLVGTALTKSHAVPSHGDKYQKIAELKKFLDEGALSKEEFEAEKRQPWE
jgi:hypothetical protein